MRTVLTIFLIFSLISGLSAQSKKRDRVKRKYRDVEKVSEFIPEVVFRGRVRDIYRNPLKGVSVEIEGLKRKVHTNEDGLFILTNLPAEMVRIKFSYTGFRTKTIDYFLQVGQNTHYVALDLDRAHIDPLPAGIQKREQHIQDIPAAVTTVSGSFAELLSFDDISGISDFIPGVNFDNSGAGSMGFFINGSNGHSGFPEVSPSAGVFIDDVPANYHNGFPLDLLDIERVEFAKGSQNALYGNSAVGGAINLVSKKPEDEFSGSLIAGGGNFESKEIKGVVNVPVLEERIFLRAAGFFRQQNGYVENTFGGSLNGVNSAGGRISIELLPFYNHKVNFKANYIKNNQPGLAMINRWMYEGENEGGFFNYKISLDGTGDPGLQQEFMDASLEYRIFRDENRYWTSISSYRKNSSSDIWDADGTALPALSMDDQRDVSIFYQELRYNFSRKSRCNGSFGLSYQWAANNNTNHILSNDRLLMDIINTPGNFLMPPDNRFPVNPQPLDPVPESDIVLTGDHNENYNIERKARLLQGYLHFTHQLANSIFFAGGIRASYDMLQIQHESEYVDGSPSFLGNYTGASPNLIYMPAEKQIINNNSLIITGQAGLTYRLNEKFNIFFNAHHGRKPRLLQFSWDGNQQIMEGEKINRLEAGWKLSLAGRIFWDVTGFYSTHEGVQTVNWRSTRGDGLLDGEGRAISYGAETGVKAALIKGVELFGNYSWMFSRFDSTDVNGLDYIYAGNSFACSPEHSFTAGINAKTDISKSLRLFLIPWYSYRSQYWFTENNSPGLSQSGYGLLNMSAGMALLNPKITLSLYGKNILEQKYIAGAGHWGGLLGIPVFIPGIPRMYGIKLKWDF